MLSPYSLLPDVTALLTIPIVTGLVGWFTNWLAIEMMFRPLKRRGIGVLAWQGVIPTRAEKMARMCVDTMTEKLVSAQELVDRIDPEEVARVLSPELQRRSERVVEAVLAQRYPKLWNALPLAVRDGTMARMKAEIPDVVVAMTEDLRRDADELIDLRALVVGAFTANVKLLNGLFWQCGGDEFRFIARSGLMFGFGFGCLQLVVWVFAQPWWFLPVTGLLVGWATNWLALKMVFEPLEERRVLGVPWQGLFLRRQAEVARAYAKFFAGEILRAEVLIDAVLRGLASDQLFSLVHRHVARAVDEVAGPGRPVVQLVAGSDAYIALKQQVCDRIVGQIPLTARHVHDYADKALDIEATLRERLTALPAAEFERVLHPVFEEDEWLLIAVGAALGLVAGVLQLMLVTL